jgi:mannose-6-phosphate isomerase-like protein (cupin superfamily)
VDWTVTAGNATRDDAERAFSDEGCGTPRSWSNGPGDRYDVHTHDRPKMLFCLEGSIVFRIDHGDVPLTAGDRLDLAPDTPHAATVGPQGCVCIEAWGP